MARPKKLLDQVREVLKVKHYSYRTEQSYVAWIRRYILFHDKQHPKDMTAEHVQRFLTHLAIDRKVTASTQNQALNAIVFLYKHVLMIELGDFSSAVRAKRPRDSNFARMSGSDVMVQNPVPPSGSFVCESENGAAEGT